MTKYIFVIGGVESGLGGILVSGVHYEAGVAIRQCASQNNISTLTSLDTVKVLLDVLEEMTIGVSTIDAE